MIEAGKTNPRLLASGVVAARAALSRRGFLLGAAGLTLGAVAAGCGGGGGNDGNVDDATYRFVDNNGEVGASVTVDRNGRVTFWTLDTAQQITDFGQTRVGRDGAFTLESVADDIRTTGEIQGSRILGRTELLSDTRRGFDWGGERVDAFLGNNAGQEFSGTYRAATAISDVDVFVLLGISSDGNATLFASFDDLTNAADAPALYRFEGLTFDRSGEVDDQDYFLDLYGDRVALRDDSQGLRLLYDFANDPDLGRLSGEQFSIPLTVSRAAEPGSSAAAPRALSGAGAQRLRAAFKAHAPVARSRQRGRRARR